MDLWKRYLTLVFSSCAIVRAVKSQSVSVDPQVTAYLGCEVTLRCQFIQGNSAVNLAQVEWTKEPVTDALAVFNPNFGKSYSNVYMKGRVIFTSETVNDASISIRNVNGTDEGKYVCKYNTFPEGTLEATTTLTVRDQPDQSRQGTAAMVSGIVTALLLIVLITTALYFVMMKRCAASTQRSRSSGDQADQVNVGHDKEVNYAAIHQFRPRPRPARGSAVQPEEATEYAEVKHGGPPASRPPRAGAGGGGEEGGGEISYGQASKR